MKRTIDHHKALQTKNVIKIRRSSIRSSLTHISNDNQSSITKSSLGQSPYKDFSNDNFITNQSEEDGAQSDYSIKDIIENNQREYSPVKLDRRTSMERTKVSRIQRNSISIPKEDKSSITFVPRKSFARIERLHGEDFIPLNNDQYSNIPQEQQRQISNRR